MATADEKRKRPLVEEIRRFRRNKIKTAAILLAIGLAGLVLPVIPGVVLILLAVWLIFPGQSERAWARLKEALAKNK